MLPIKLSHSTGQSDFGPIVFFRLGELNVWYDSDDTWMRLRFGSCIAVRFTPDPCVTAAMIEAYSKVLEQPESDWLRDLRATTKNPSLLSGLHHMLVYFDHYGCLELIAKSASVEEDSEPPPQLHEKVA